MGAGGHAPRRPCRADQLPDHSVVLAVDTGDAPRLLQPQQGAVHLPLADHHGGVGHIHFKGGDPLLRHLPDLPADALVPVVYGHMEAVVAGGAAFRLLPPARQPRRQRLPLVRGGEVDHRGGAPPEGRPAAGGKVVGGDGAPYLQIKMGVAVDEAGEEQLPRAVHHPPLPGAQIRPHGGDLLPLQQYVQALRAPSRDHVPAPQQNAHLAPPCRCCLSDRLSIAHLGRYRKRESGPESPDAAAGNPGAAAARRESGAFPRPGRRRGSEKRGRKCAK